MGGEVARCRLVGWNALVEVAGGAAVRAARPDARRTGGPWPGRSAAGQARVGERSMGTGGRSRLGARRGRSRRAPLAGRFAAPMARSSLQQHQSATGSGPPRRAQAYWNRFPLASAGSGIEECRSPDCGGAGASSDAHPRTGRTAKGRRRPARPPDRAGRRRPTSAAHRRRTRSAPRPAPARRPPCPVGRCRCRTWATARTTDSRCGIRTRRSPPGWRRASAAALRAPAPRNPAPPGCPSCTKTVGRPVYGCSAVDMPPMSQRSQIANSGRIPMAACSAACSAPGTRAMIHPDRVEGGLVEVVPDPTRVQGLPREVERHGLQHRAVRCAPLVLHHLRGHRHLAERHPHRAALPAGEHCGHFDVGRRAGVGAPVRGGGAAPARPRRRDRGPARGSSRRGAGTPRRRARWRAPSRRPPCRASARCPPRPRPPVRARIRGCPRCPPGGPGRGPEPPGRTAPQHPVGHQLVEHRARRRSR